mmetsp:Transcript_13754/g.28367  ORF Transcript_13754/g.28367 Transcript_13754/m.28367 type:complete len:94 (-) Transcript_13754:4495-4776(-)
MTLPPGTMVPLAHNFTLAKHADSISKTFAATVENSFTASLSEIELLHALIPGLLLLRHPSTPSLYTVSRGQKSVETGAGNSLNPVESLNPDFP